MPVIVSACLPNMTAETSVLLHRKFPFMEKDVAALIIAKSHFVVPIQLIIARLEAHREPHFFAT